MKNNLDYNILNYWKDDDGIYVNYIVNDKERDLKANTIAYFNISDFAFDYHRASDEELKTELLILIKNNSCKEFKLPKVSELSELLKYVYFQVCESDSNMCYIDEEEWQELCKEKKYTNKDLTKLQDEILKYQLKDYITIDSDCYKICCYGGIQCCFNDDTIDKNYDELEL